MSKNVIAQTKDAPVMESPPSGPVSMVPPVPSNMEAPRPAGPPFHRQRGICRGPVCNIPGCGSDMISNRIERTNHPFTAKVYYKCLNPKCPNTAGPFKERRR